MKRMKVHDLGQLDKPMGLRGKIIKGLGDKLAERSLNPRECPAWFIYEPEISYEILAESFMDQ